MTRSCSQCGGNGHNARTCDHSSSAEGGGGDPGGEIMLFGVRVKVDPLRKTVSLGDLSKYERRNGNNNVPKNSNESNGKAVDDTVDAASYASADEVVHHQNTGGRERKRGIPWTEEEHKLFLLGLQKVGKGDWRGISRNFVKTRTPTQVASHAQKYFIRKSNLNRRRRRSSLFDITTDSVTGESTDGGKSFEDNMAHTVLPLPSLPALETANNMKGSAFKPVLVPVAPISLPVQAQYPLNTVTSYQGNYHMPNPSAVMLYSLPFVTGGVPLSSTRPDLSADQKLGFESTPLSLRLSLGSDQGQIHSARRRSTVRATLKDGDSIISVA